MSSARFRNGRITHTHTIWTRKKKCMKFFNHTLISSVCFAWGVSVLNSLCSALPYNLLHHAKRNRISRRTSIRTAAHKMRTAHAFNTLLEKNHTKFVLFSPSDAASSQQVNTVITNSNAKRWNLSNRVTMYTAQQQQQHTHAHTIALCSSSGKIALTLVQRRIVVVTALFFSVG